MKKLGPVNLAGDGNVCELSLMCEPCQGTGLIPPRGPFTVSQNASNECATCKGARMHVHRFGSIGDMKTFVGKL